MIEKEWIEEVKVHFEKIPDKGMKYSDGDELSLRSKKINSEFKKLIENKFKNTGLILDKSGNKWGVQGHKKLKNYIWYRIYDEEYGKNYPIVLNISINKNGFNFTIDVYENKISEKSSDKLVQLLKNKLSDNDQCKWQNNDYGYFNLNELNENIISNIIEIYKNTILEIKIPGDIENTFITIGKDNGTTPTILVRRGEDMDKNTISKPLNQILYGPPGTGKTYNTINKALEIIFEKEENETIIDYSFQDHKLNKSIKDLKIILNKKYINENERKDLKTTFYFYKDQIEFITFHQSYGYEEFVEGIKPCDLDNCDSDRSDIKYTVDDGIFKKLCERATDITITSSSKYDFQDEVNIWKISLGDTQSSNDEFVYDYCIENKKILLGFGKGLDFSDCPNREAIAKKLDNMEKYSYPPTAINTFKNNIKRGDIVLVSYGNTKLRAVAKVIGEYELLENDELQTYVQARDVEWLIIPEKPFPYEIILKKKFSQMSLYNIKNNVKIDALQNILSNDNVASNSSKNYVLIIDEINRGNISKIFGELITLIEPSKRIGEDEEIKLVLPNSKDPFGVPKNLYIIGTMNTADRSIAQIDTALRRRFVFEEMMPNPELLVFDKNTSKPLIIQEKDQEINVQELLKAINERIEYIHDREHTIGHSYFMPLINDPKKSKLDEIFRVKIIPLLAEYFYGDWGDMADVLNDENDYFIVDRTKKLKYRPKRDRQNKVYSINKEFTYKAYINIYNGIPLIKDTSILPES